MQKIRVSGNRFVDEQGRHVILHGINMVCKDKSRNYIGDWGDTDFAKLKQWGFNVIRLGVIWDGVEPEPGIYDLAYLERLRSFIRLADRHGLHVYLDMHQDLFTAHPLASGQVAGDGAPAWASLMDGETFVPGEVWSDAYLFNRAVQKVFDHFWNNAPAPDGIGLLDHYALAWRQVVLSLGGEPNVIGYDLMNEPFIGSEVQTTLQQMLAAFATLTEAVADTPEIPATSDPAPNARAPHGIPASGAHAPDARTPAPEPAAPAPPGLAAIWSDPQAKAEVMQALAQPELFRAIMLQIAPSLQQFERTKLMHAFTKVAQAIREADPDGILFLETNYFSNIGVPSGIEPVRQPDGMRDAQQAYAPHGYDLVTDTNDVHNANGERVSFIFESHGQTQARLNMPMLIGEWGAYEQSRQAGDAAAHIQRIFERLLCSDTYWGYSDRTLEKYDHFLSLCRGYPMATAGTLLHYRYQHGEDRKDRILFSMEWLEDGSLNCPTVVYLPDITAFKSVELAPTGTGYEIISLDGSKAGFLHIPACHDGRRTLELMREI